MGVVVRRYIDFLILLIPTPCIYLFFFAASLLFVHLKKCFFSIIYRDHTEKIIKINLKHAYAQ